MKVSVSTKIFAEVRQNVVFFQLSSLLFKLELYRPGAHFSKAHEPYLKTGHSKCPVGISSELKELNVDSLNKITYRGTNRCLAYLRTIRLHFSLSKHTAR
jgi:hypothetical protein